MIPIVFKHEFIIQKHVLIFVSRSRIVHFKSTSSLDMFNGAGDTSATEVFSRWELNSLPILYYIILYYIIWHELFQNNQQLIRILTKFHSFMKHN